MVWKTICLNKKERKKLCIQSSKKFPYFIFGNIPYSISIRTIIQERSVTIPRSEKPYVTTGKYSF